MAQTQILTGGRLLAAVIALNLANGVAFADLTSMSSISSAAAIDLAAQATITWAATSTLVAATICQCVLGYLSDIFGRRPVLNTALVLLMLGSLGCGLAHYSGSAAHLYIFRAMTGAAVGSISNLVNVRIRTDIKLHHSSHTDITCFQITQNDYLSPEKRANYQGIQGVSVAIGSVIGIMCGAAFSLRDPRSPTGWPMFYFVQAILALTVLIAINCLLPPPPAKHPDRKFYWRELDWLGMLFGGGAVVPLLVAATEGDRFGWASAETVALLVMGTVCAVVFVILGCREPLEIGGVRARPIMPFRLFRNATIAVIFLQCFLSGTAYYTFIVFMPRYFVEVRGEDKMVAAAMMVPYFIGHGMWSSVSPQVMKRLFGTERPAHGYKCIALFGFTCWATAMLILGFLPRSSPVAALVVLATLVGLGTGSVFQNSVNAIRSQVDADDLAVAVSARNVIRYLGGAVGTAVATAIDKRLRAGALPEHLHRYIDQTLVERGLAKLSSTDLARLSHADFVGMNGILILGGIATVLAAISCLFIRESIRESSRGSTPDHRADSMQPDLEMQTPQSSNCSTQLEKPSFTFVRLLLPYKGTLIEVGGLRHGTAESDGAEKGTTPSTPSETPAESA